MVKILNISITILINKILKNFNNKIEKWKEIQKKWFYKKYKSSN